MTFRSRAAILAIAALSLAAPASAGSVGDCHIGAYRLAFDVTETRFTRGDVTFAGRLGGPHGAARITGPPRAR